MRKHKILMISLCQKLGKSANIKFDVEKAQKKQVILGLVEQTWMKKYLLVMKYNASIFIAQIQ